MPISYPHFGHSSILEMGCAIVRNNSHPLVYTVSAANYQRILYTSTKLPQPRQSRFTSKQKANPYTEH